ncbi:MAG: hypothetical protein Q7S58_21285 [Candidatus Binatus sp.]|uniref:hypothetical protein n=1 Tax=Candidatus Binatus sp. TaxID=2811406 RepID=UPI00271DC6F6|nr:hypothetical protein [Candidatus Binatus sp.]MDO8434941.1 hypothetical protein [Candidatus Binatus sp.]
MSDPNRPDYFFSVALVGAMNPAIHHYAWYLHENILKKEEADIAAQSGAGVCTAQLSQLQFGAILIFCDPIRWQISTSEIQAVGRIVKIADDTFSVLRHTPVSAFGFNFNHHRSTRLPKVNNTLARMVRSLPLGLISEDREESAGKLNYQHSVGGGRVITVQIEPSVRGPDQVYVAVNVEYRMTAAAGEFKAFELKLEERFPGDRKFAEQQLEFIVKALNSLEAN